MKTFSKAACKITKCENSYKWQIMWKITDQKGFPSFRTVFYNNMATQIK